MANIGRREFMRMGLAIPIGLLGGNNGFTPVTLSNLKLWLDDSDPATLFQDAALTTPAVADTDPVGVAKDKSGNGFNAASLTTARPPLKLNILNGKPVLRFDGTNNYLDTADASSPAISQPSTIFIVGRATVLDATFIDSKTVSLKQMVDRSSDSTTPGSWRMFAGSSVVSAAQKADSKYNVITAQFNGASSFLRVGGFQVASGNPGAGAIAGIVLGSRGGGTHSTKLTGDIAEVIIYSGAKTLAEIQQVEAYLGTKWALNTLGGTWNIICEGDSLTSGTGATARGAYPLQLGDIYITNVPYARLAITNSGTGGATLADMYADRATVRALSDPTKERNSLIIWGGTNDFGAGASEATVLQRLLDLVDYHVLSGFDPVIVNTMLPRTDASKPAGFDANRALFNTHVLSNAAAHGYRVSDIAADSRIGDDGDSNDTTYYDAAKLHMNNTGYGVKASIDAAALA